MLSLMVQSTNKGKFASTHSGLAVCGQTRMNIIMLNLEHALGKEGMADRQDIHGTNQMTIDCPFSYVG